MTETSYSKSIQKAFEYLLSKNKNIVVMGQGLWSPWYVGSTMIKLEKKFGTKRILDTPVSENATTGMAFGASISGLRPIVVHPRMDFMVLAMDQIINQISKWKYMLGGRSSSNITIRSIINRGGEQGAQHSQSLQSWFVHVPGLIVAMPSTPQDAYDMFVSSVLSNKPVIFIDDRWLYEEKQKVNFRKKIKNITDFKPQIYKQGNDATLVSYSFGMKMAKKIEKKFENKKVTLELIDLRLLNPLDLKEIIKSVKKTKKLIVVDYSWSKCSIASEVIASVSEKINGFKSLRINISNTPAPSSKSLEKIYYPDEKEILKKIKFFLKSR